MDAAALKKAWMNFKPVTSTRNAPNVDSRLFWVGLPNQDTKDFLGLQGMELRLTWRDPGQSITEEVIVSQIVFNDHLCSFNDPDNRRVTWHDYRVSIIQCADSESAYGQLIQQQRKKGIASEEKLYVTEQIFRCRIKIGPIIDHLKSKFRQYLGDNFPSVTLRDGIILSPLDTVIDEMGYLPVDKLLIGAKRRIIQRKSSFLDSLSDLVIDRIYELQAMVAAWHFNLNDNKVKRFKRSKDVKRELQKLVLERSEQNLLIAECNQDLEVLQVELKRLKSHVACLVKVDPSSDPEIEHLNALILKTEQEIRVVVQEIESLTVESSSVLRKWGAGEKFQSVSLRKVEAERRLNALSSSLLGLKSQIQKHLDSAEVNFQLARAELVSQTEEREREREALNERLKHLESTLLQTEEKIALAQIEVETYS